MATEASEKAEPKKSAAKAKKASPKKTPAKAPKKKPEFGAKSDFIRSMPREMSAKDVVEAAQKKGLTLTDNLVYAVRAASKKSAGTKGSDRQQEDGLPKAVSGKGSKPAPASSLEVELQRHRRAGPSQGSGDLW
ncbi:MAG: hypothetical protein IPG04_12715 [Polyangiaceae bacterium]|nr:hypothetical protein [Polyangiaceae bacterium]